MSKDMIATSSGAMAACAASPWTRVEDALPDAEFDCLVIDHGNFGVCYFDEVWIYNPEGDEATGVTHWAQINKP
jgi:hypothetical protein